MSILRILLFLPIVSCVIAAAAAFTPIFRGENRFFLDTADPNQWYDLMPLGIFYGITTNPSILEACQQPCTVENIHTLARRALLLTQEFMVQAWGETATDLYETGMALSQVDRERIVIKVPVTFVGVQAAHLLHQAGVRTCLTACYDANQALLAATVGSEYIAPYLGRMDDAGKDGQDHVERMLGIVEGLGSDTRILVASIRSVDDIAQLARAGHDTFTFSPTVARQLFDEPLTMQAAEDFEQAAKRGGASTSAS